MGILSELKKSLGIVVDQLTNSSHVTLPSKPNPKAIQFTQKFYSIAKQANLTEADALDVYYHGEPGSKENSLVRKYMTQSKVLEQIFGEDTRGGKRRQETTC